MRYTVGTRGSRLSLAQTRATISSLEEMAPGTEYEIKTITTHGDTDQRPLFEMDRRGMFAREIDAAVARGDVDFAVHSLKDVPTGMDDMLELACVPRRGRACDVLVSRDGASLDSLKAGAIVGTSSLRRAVQVRRRRSDIEVRPVRGNIETRIAKTGSGYDAVVLAAAGIGRLGLDVQYSELPEDDFVPSPGQGALALVCKRGSPVAGHLRHIEHAASRREADAERAFSTSVESGCRFPVGARAVSGDEITLTAEAFSADGSESIRAVASGRDPAYVGRAAASEMRARGVSDLALNWRKMVEEWNR